MYTIESLIPFECIVDIDMGLIKLLKYEYRNLDYFFKGILDGEDVYLQYELMRRKNRNPLSIAADLQKTPMGILDNWYAQFLEKEYSRIIELSNCTGLADITKVASFNSDRILRNTILCRNNIEAELVRKRTLGENKIVVHNGEGFDVGKYDAIYLKDVYDIQRYTGIVGKSLYFANYGFNLIDNPEDDELILEYDPIINYINDNEIRIYSVYKIDPSQIPVD